MVHRLFAMVLLLLFVLTCKQRLNNQEYGTLHKRMRIVKEFAENGDNEKAMKFFTQLEDEFAYIPSRYYLEAREIAFSAGNCDKTYDYFEKAVQNGFDFRDWDSASFLECEKINNSVLLKFDKYNDALNSDYKRLIDSMYAADQASRRSGDSDWMSKVDSGNAVLLQELLHLNGYPSENVIGAKSARRAYILMLHFDSDLNNEILGPFIDEAFSSGKIGPSEYAWIIDRRRHWGKGIEPYYYQMPSPELKNLSEDVLKIVDSRRDSIGLKPLSDIKIEYNDDGSITVWN